MSGPKRIVQCECGAQTTPNKWRQAGWIKVSFTLGGSLRGVVTKYTCNACRESNAAAAVTLWEADVKANPPKRVYPAPKS